MRDDAATSPFKRASPRSRGPVGPPLRKAEASRAGAGLVGLAAVVSVGAGLCFGAVLVNGDTLFALTWGRELLHWNLDSFQGGPTPHPLINAAGAVTALLGEQAGYVATYVMFGPLALGALVASAFEVARRLAGAWAGLAAIGLLLTSRSVLANAATARYDVAFVAFVLAAVALMMARPRRGAAPLVLLTLAGLIRPEAWGFALVYYVWLYAVLPSRSRVMYAVLTASGPALWLLMDWMVTGDPLYSFHMTEQASGSLYGRFTPSENLIEAARRFASYVGLIPLLLIPLALIVPASRRREVLPLIVVAATSSCVFVAFALRGIASSERYLFLPACAVLILAGAAAAGWGVPSPRRVFAATIASALLLLQVVAHADRMFVIGDQAKVLAAHNSEIRELARRPPLAGIFANCPRIGAPGRNMTAAFAYFATRPPEDWTIDNLGRTRPDVFVAPATPEVADDVLTRRRFDDDSTFKVPPGMTPRFRSARWRVFVRAGSPCVQDALAHRMPARTA